MYTLPGRGLQQNTRILLSSRGVLQPVIFLPAFAGFMAREQLVGFPVVGDLFAPGIKF